MMQFMNDFATTVQGNLKESTSLDSNATSYVRPTSSDKGQLTTHVWPKSRMLFAIVSKMQNAGVLTAE